MTLVRCKSGGGGVGTLAYYLIENHYRQWILLRIYTIQVDFWNSTFLVDQLHWRDHTDLNPNKLL